MIKLTPEKMPYYEIVDGYPKAPLIRTATQTTIVESDGTNETTVQTITLPANTLNKNGDIVTLNYWGNSYNLPQSAQVRIEAFGTSLGAHGWINNYAWQLKGNIMRVTSNIVYYTSQLILNAAMPQLLQGSIGSIDFTIENDITLSIQVAIDGNMRSAAGYTQILNA